MQADNFSNLAFENYQINQKKKQKLIVSIVILIVALILVCAIYSVFFVPRPMAYKDVKLSCNWTEDEILEITLHNVGMYCGYIGDLGSEPYLINFVDGLVYRDRYFTYENSLWNRWLYTNNIAIFARYTTEGVLCNTEGSEGHYDANGKYHQLIPAQSRIYYKNPDGSLVLVWDFLAEEE